MIPSSSQSNLELRVGVFVILALAALSFLVFKAGDFSLDKGYDLRFVFDTATGISKGTLVCLSGVDIGEVRSTRVARSAEGKTQIEIVAHIAEGVIIEKDADIQVQSDGILGEKFIQVLPGSPGAESAGSGATLIGNNSVSVSELADQSSRLLEKLGKTMDAINTSLADPKLNQDLKATFAGTGELMTQLKEAAEDMKVSAKLLRTILARIEGGQGTIGRLLKDDTIARNLEELSEDVKRHPWKLLKRF